MSNPIPLEPLPRDESEPYLVLGHLSSTVVHHLINAFSAIVSQAEALKTLAESSGVPRAEASSRAEAIVKAALDASNLARKLDDVGMKATTCAGELVDLNGLLSDRIADQKSRPGSNVRWDLDLAVAAEMRGAAPQLQIMLDQLLDNAREAVSVGGGVVAVSTVVEASGRLVLEIRDNGSGMAPEIMEHAIEPFFSTKPGRPGLGLALARGIWRRHRGGFAIESEPGRGTVVRLSWSPAPRAS